MGGSSELQGPERWHLQLPRPHLGDRRLDLPCSGRGPFQQDDRALPGPRAGPDGRGEGPEHSTGRRLCRRCGWLYRSWCFVGPDPVNSEIREDDLGAAASTSRLSLRKDRRARGACWILEHSRRPRMHPYKHWSSMILRAAPGWTSQQHVSSIQWVFLDCCEGLGTQRGEGSEQHFSLLSLPPSLSRSLSHFASCCLSNPGVFALNFP